MSSRTNGRRPKGLKSTYVRDLIFRDILRFFRASPQQHVSSLCSIEMTDSRFDLAYIELRLFIRSCLNLSNNIGVDPTSMSFYICRMTASRIHYPCHIDRMGDISISLPVWANRRVRPFLYRGFIACVPGQTHRSAPTFSFFLSYRPHGRYLYFALRSLTTYRD